MKGRRSERTADLDYLYSLWVLKGRSDAGPVLRLLALLYDSVEEHVVRRALQRLAKKGRVPTTRQGRRVQYGPVETLDVGDIVSMKLRRQQENWNGRWCLLTYDLPQRAQMMRKRLVRLMRTVGMGMWTQSSWISPYDWANLLCEQAIEFGASSYLHAATDAVIALPEGATDLAARVWDLDDLAARYRHIIAECNRILRRRTARAAQQRAASRAAHRACISWVTLQQDDPMLPAELLPGDWPASLAETRIDEVRRRIKSFVCQP